MILSLVLGKKNQGGRCYGERNGARQFSFFIFKVKISYFIEKVANFVLHFRTSKINRPIQTKFSRKSSGSFWFFKK